MSAQGTYLERIVADVEARLRSTSPISPAEDPAAIRSLAASIRSVADAGRIGVIAEVKRRSPSVGAIAPDVDPARQGSAYATAGAAGISVLTEPDHFAGSLDDLRDVRSATAALGTPVLRKDFIVHERQLHDARAVGADAVLLIAALHEVERLAALVDAATVLGLEVLMEVHDEQDLERALATSATLIGINNRDLHSFHVDLAVTERLAPLVPADRIVVAESGIRTADDARRMRAAGATALLVGETLMRADDPASRLTELGAAALEVHG